MARKPVTITLDRALEPLLDKVGTLLEAVDDDESGASEWVRGVAEDVDRHLIAFRRLLLAEQTARAR